MLKSTSAKTLEAPSPDEKGKETWPKVEQNSAIAILFTRILVSLQQRRGKSYLKLTSFVGKMQKLNIKTV